MMIDEYYQNILLSEAAYLDLESGLPLLDSIASFDGESPLTELPLTVLNDFSDRYVVLDSLNTTFVESGLSVTVFYDTVENKHIMAVRGTDFEIAGINDIAGADVADIGLDGVAIHQGIDLYNYYLRLITPPNETVVQYEYKPPTDVIVGLLKVEIVPARIEIDSIVPGEMPAPTEVEHDLSQGFTVVGHSLGGHLAMLMSYLAGDAVTDVYAYDAPGFANLVGLGFDEYLSLFIEAGEPVSTISTANVYLLDGLYDLASELPAYTRPGSDTAESLFTEVDGLVSGHKLGYQVPVLALARLFEQLDATVDLASINNILEAASVSNGSSLEHVLTDLSELFSIPLVPAATGSTVWTDKAFYEQIETVANNAQFQAAAQQAGQTLVVDVSGYDAATIVSEANNHIGVLYALVNLNTFAVIGDASMYATFDPTEYSDQYLADKADFIVARNLIGMANELYYETSVTPNYFEDYESGIVVDQRPPVYDVHGGLSQTGSASRYIFGSEESDYIGGGSLDDHLYGGNGSDSIRAYEGADYIEGGQGDDLLDGGADVDPDRLEGGDGDDTYIASMDDVISDADGIGRVIFDGVVLYGGISTSAGGAYTSADGELIYSLTGSTLAVSNANGSLTIENYTNGDLGISLIEEEQEVYGSVALSLSSDPSGVSISVGEVYDIGSIIYTDRYLTGESYTDETLKDQYWVPLGGGIGEIRIPGHVGVIYGNGGADLLRGTPLVMAIYGGAGNDQVYGYNVAHGDEGNDIVQGSEAYGGPGDDTVLALGRL